MSSFEHTQRVTSIACRIVTVVLVAVLGGIVGSCSVVDFGSSDGTDGHVLRLAGSTFGPTTLDPARVRDAESAFLSSQIFRGLVSLDRSLQPQPELAQTIEVSDDLLSYTFTLYENGTFHDGSPINAEAVVRSFARASDPALAGGDGAAVPAATHFADIEGIDDRLSGRSSTISGIAATGLWTLEITLHRPAVNFLSKLAGSPAAIVDVRTASGPDWWQQANGSGPFKVSSYMVGEGLELARFAAYSPGAPRLDSVTVVFGSDAAQPLNLYEQGRVDVTEVPDWAIDRVLSLNDPLHPQMVQTAQLSTTFIAMNPNIEPFDDPKVRHMIASGIDRRKIVEVMLNDRVQLAMGLIAPGVLDTEWPADISPFDLDAVEKLAATVGDVQPPPTLVEPGGGISTTIATVLMRDAGVQLNVVDRPWPEFAGRLGGREMPGFVLTWIADYPDPENMLAGLLRSGSPDNYIGYSNAKFDSLVDQANQEGDATARRELYLEAQQLAIDDAVIIPLYHQVSYTLVKPGVHGLEVTEIGILSLEDVWIED